MALPPATMATSTRRLCPRKKQEGGSNFSCKKPPRNLQFLFEPRSQKRSDNAALAINDWRLTNSEAGRHSHTHFTRSSAARSFGYATFLAHFLISLAIDITDHSTACGNGIVSRPPQRTAAGRAAGNNGNQRLDHRHTPIGTSPNKVTKQPSRARSNINGGGAPTLKSKNKPSKKEHTGPYLACPYYKRNPLLHQRCLLRNDLTETSFVVQHVERAHPRLPIHCPCCGEIFATRAENDIHVRGRTCNPREFRHEGLTEDQLVALRIPRRNLNEVERWYSLWDILFPGEPRPASPYVSEPFVEILGVVRRVLTSIESRSSEFTGTGPIIDYLIHRGLWVWRIGEPLTPGDHETMESDLIDNFLNWDRIRPRIPDRDNLAFLASDRPPANLQRQANPPSLNVSTRSTNPTQATDSTDFNTAMSLDDPNLWNTFGTTEQTSIPAEDPGLAGAHPNPALQPNNDNEDLYGASPAPEKPPGWTDPADPGP